MPFFACLIVGIIASAGRTPSSASTRPASAPTRVRFVLEQPPSDTARDNAAFEAELAKQAAARLKEAAASQPSGPPTAAAIKAARFLLGRNCEPALSRVLLGIAEPRDAALLTKTAAQVAALLHPAPASQPTKDAGDTRAAEPSAETALLDAVAQAYSAIGHVPNANPRTTETAREALLDAGRALAPYLDDPRSDVAALARLLQGACYRRANRPDRAVQVLGGAGRPGAALPYEVFARMEHCRALADQHYYVAAMALAVRHEAHCNAWIPVAHRTAAAHGFRRLRIVLLDEWARQAAQPQSRPAGPVARADAIDGHAEKLLQSFGSAGPVALYRFGHVLPDQGE